MTHFANGHLSAKHQAASPVVTQQSAQLKKWGAVKSLKDGCLINAPMHEVRQMGEVSEKRAEETH